MTRHNRSGVRRRPAKRGSCRRYDVVFYAPWIAPLLAGDAGPGGGAETQLYLLARELAALGWRAAVVAYPHPKLPRRVGEVEVIERSPPAGRLPLVGKLAETRAVWSSLARADAEVFVQRAAGFETGLVALAARARGSRFVYSSANVIDFDFGRLEKRKRNVFGFESGVRLADVIVVQTREQEALCERRFGRRPVLIKSIAERAPRRSQTPTTFVWIGRLTEYKRPLAFVDLARSVPAASFEMVAVPTAETTPKLTDALTRAARELDNLRILAPRPRSEIIPVIERAAAVVNTADYEGMPNVFLEGWARGVPALALAHDPDGVIEREGLGGFARGSQARLVELATEAWATRDDQAAVAASCQAYIDREHSPAAVAASWATALGLQH